MVKIGSVLNTRWFLPDNRYIASIMETYIIYKQFAKPREVNHPIQETVDFWMKLLVQACKPTVSTAHCPVRHVFSTIHHYCTIQFLLLYCINHHSLKNKSKNVENINKSKIFVGSHSGTNQSVPTQHYKCERGRRQPDGAAKTCYTSWGKHKLGFHVLLGFSIDQKCVY